MYGFGLYVKEPEVWAENKQIQNTTQQQASLPLFAIFKRKYLFNTLTGCLWMAGIRCGTPTLSGLSVQLEQLRTRCGIQ